MSFNTILSKGPRYAYLSSGRDNLSLNIQDIPGAQPKLHGYSKNVNHYEQRMVNGLQNTDVTYRLQHVAPGAGLFHHSDQRASKKHFIKHYESEIGHTNAMKGNLQGNVEVEIFDFPRNLFTQDIPGAVPGTLKSKAVGIVEKFRRAGSVPRERIEHVGTMKPAGFTRNFQYPENQTHAESGSCCDSCSKDKNSTEKKSCCKSKNQAASNEQAHHALANQNDQMDQAPKNEDIHAPEAGDRNTFVEGNMARNDVPENENRFEGNYEPATPEYIQQDQRASYQPSNMRQSAIGLRNDERNTPTPLRNAAWPAEIENPSNLGGSRGQFNCVTTLQHSRSGMMIRHNSNPRLHPGYLEPIRPEYLNQTPLTQNQDPQSRNRQSLCRSSSDLKKVYTFNILNNQPHVKMIPQNAKIPYKYAIAYEEENNCDADGAQNNQNGGAFVPLHSRGMSTQMQGYNNFNPQQRNSMQEDFRPQDGRSTPNRYSMGVSPLRSVYQGISQGFKGY